MPDNVSSVLGTAVYRLYCCIVDARRVADRRWRHGDDSERLLLSRDRLTYTGAVDKSDWIWKTIGERVKRVEISAVSRTQRNVEENAESVER